MPLGHEDQDDRFLALAALVVAGVDPERAPTATGATPVPAALDDLASRRQRRNDEHALARSRHPSAHRRQSA